MAINLQKHKGELRKAWEDVHNPECEDNWVIFGYDGKTYELKVIEKGDGGLEEMVDSLSGGKIMYAAARVMDPNTDLPKLVFVNWQGEGVPSSVKGTCASHWRDVTDFFKGAHVTIQARSEDDLDSDVVMDKVTKSSGANYSFHQERPKPITNPSGQVGTNYKRVNPLAEINVKSRDKFWMEQERAEQQRIEDEKKRLANARQAEEEQRKRREAKEQAERDRLVRERAESIESQRVAAKKELDRRKEEEKKRYEETIREANKDDEEFRCRSESLRKKRLKEAQELIRERKKSFGEMSPREAFEPSSKKVPPPVQPKTRSGSRQRSGTTEGTDITEEEAKPSPPVTQPKPNRSSQPVLPRPVPEPVREPSPKPVRKPQPVRQPSPERKPLRQPSPEPEPLRQPSPEPEPEFEPQKPPEAQHPQDVYEEITMTSSNKITTQEAYSDIPDHDTPLKEGSRAQREGFYESVDEVFHKSEPPAGNAQTTAEETRGASDGLTVQAVYDYQAVDDTEITFDPGDIITEVEQIDEGWWRGKAPNGYFGMFPANYVTVLADPVQEPDQKLASSTPTDEIYEQIETPSQPVASEPVADEVVEVGLTARAMYDYQAADDSEISFDPGDIITQIKQIDKDWWTGATSRGQYGMFPANFVELISEDQEAAVSDVFSPADSGLCAKAVFDYQAADETEISFDPGDIITSIEQVDSGWWKGTGPSGANGLFPANYVELIS